MVGGGSVHAVTLLAAAVGAPTSSSADGPTCYSRLTNEWICGQYVKDFRPEIQHATIEHLQITALAIVLGVLIAFPLALLARRVPRLESGILAVTTGIYTVPSLALFPLLVPFTGLSATTVVIGSRSGWYASMKYRCMSWISSAARDESSSQGTRLTATSSRAGIEYGAIGGMANSDLLFSR